MKGYLKQITGLWRVKTNDNYNVQTKKSIINDGIKHKVNSILPEETIYDVIRLIHKSLNKPTKWTRLKEIDNNGDLDTSPMTKETTLKKDLPKS